jgi:hypothetical protein
LEEEAACLWLEEEEGDLDTDLAVREEGGELAGGEEGTDSSLEASE